MQRNRFIEWSRKEYSKRQRIMTMIPMGILFVIIIPYSIVSIAQWGLRNNITSLVIEPLNLIVSILLIMFGAVYAVWSVREVFEEGRGTPAPMMPTQQLLQTGPFALCRNPMALGIICCYLGVAVYTGSPASLGLWLLLTAFMIIYIRLVEEKELQLRFGLAYVEYKQRVPFIIPRRE